VPLTLILTALGIIGGAPSTDDAVVCLTADGLALCSGVVIDAHTVLTAGHCINPLGTSVSYVVNVGADCAKPDARVRVAEMVAHPSYTGEGKPFDVGLVRTTTALNVTPVKLRDGALDDSFKGSLLRHVGFGTDQEQPMSGRGLRRTVSHALLRLDADFVWSGDATANTCLGDSGGPALLDDAVIAVVSDGPDCHSESADQRLDVARAWLDETRARFDPAPTKPPPQGCSMTTEAAAGLALLLALCRRRSARVLAQHRPLA
jgi:secreted trypsin-like serine protease